MVQVPAFCDKCNNIFQSGINFENTTNVTMTGNTSQCPNCNHMARVPDGIFNFYKNGIEVLQATEATIKDLQKFYAIVQKASIVETALQEVKQEIEKEVPKLSFLAKYLPQNAKELGLYLTAIGSLIGGMAGSIEINSNNTEVNHKTEIHQNFNEEQTYQLITPSLEVNTPIVLPNKKVGRNEPCPCVSGFKYKYCHGK